jgi:alcohol dehydrogenase class IV
VLRCLANSGLGTAHHLAAAGARLSALHGAVCAAVFATAMDTIELSDEEVSEIVTHSL